MGMRTEWRVKGIYKADSDKVALELEEIGNPTIDAILDKARDKSTELHKCFEWDDGIAADKYRRWQAAQIRIHLVYKKKEGKKEYVPVRVFNKASETEWKPTEVIVKNADEYNFMLRNALMELEAFQKKYSGLQELAELIDVISQYTAELKQ